MTFDTTAGPTGTTMAASPSPSTENQPALLAADIVVVVLYFVLVLAVGFWSMWRTKRSTVDGYFLAGKNMTWWPVGASLFASNISSKHLIGLAGSGAATGISIAIFEWGAIPVLALLGWIFLPIYIAAGVTTMPEYLQKRFGGRRIQISVTVLYLFLYIFVKISVDMYAGAFFMQMVLQWNIYFALVLLLAITALYTLAGGLAAVIYTDAAQTVIMLVGAFILMGFSFAEVGGWDAMMERYPAAIASVRPLNSTCGIPRYDAFHLFRDPVNSDLPWPGLIFGLVVSSICYWCTDQVIVQRSLAAKNLTHAKGGSLLAAYLKLLPFFLIVLPGMISRILFTDEVACADPELCRQICGNPVGCSDTAYIKLIVELLPTGLRGLMMAVMLAALMSSLTSLFNSASTIFTLDLWKNFRSQAVEWELMIVGRVFVLVLLVVSVLWIPIVQASQGGLLFVYTAAINTSLQPPVSVIFIMGCLWTRTNEKGAFWALAIGVLVGCIRVILDFIYTAPLCHEEDNRPAVLKNVHYLYFSSLLTFISLIVVVVVSLATEKPRPEQISRLTWFTRFDPVEKPKELVTEIEKQSSTEACDQTNEAESGESSNHRQSRLMTAIYWLCGMVRREKGGADLVTPPTPEAALTSLREKPRLRLVMNLNLIICLCATVFIMGYWA